MRYLFKIIFVIVAVQCVSIQAFAYQYVSETDTVKYYSTAPRFSEDGRSVLFYSYREEEYGADLYSVNLKDKSLNWISKTRMNEWWFDILADGKYLVSTDHFLDEPFAGGDISLFDASTQNFTKLSKSSGDGVFDILPRISPDHSGIVYCHDCINPATNMDIHMMNLDGSNDRAIVKTDFNERNAVWSPDGDKILFSSNREGNYQLYEYYLQTEEILCLDVQHQGMDVLRGEYSPDGSRIVYQVKVNDQISELHIMNLKTGETRKITTGEFRDTLPAWSPDGTKIAFASYRFGKRDKGTVMVLDLKEDVLERLTF